MSISVEIANHDLFLESVSCFKQNIKGLRSRPGSSVHQYYNRPVAAYAICRGNQRLYSMLDLLLSRADTDISSVCQLFPWIPQQLLISCSTLFRYLALADVKDWSSRCLDAMASSSGDQLLAGYWEFVIWTLNDPVYGLRQFALEDDSATIDAVEIWALAMACGETLPKVAITAEQNEFAWGSYIRSSRRDAIKALYYIDGADYIFFVAEANQFCSKYDRLRAIAEKLVEFISRGY